MVNVPTLPFAKFPCHIAFPNGIEFAVFGAIQLEFELVGMLLVLSHFLKIGGGKITTPFDLAFYVSVIPGRLSIARQSLPNSYKIIPFANSFNDCKSLFCVFIGSCCHRVVFIELLFHSIFFVFCMC